MENKKGRVVASGEFQGGQSNQENASEISKFFESAKEKPLTSKNNSKFEIKLIQIDSSLKQVLMKEFETAINSPLFLNSFPLLINSFPSLSLFLNHLSSHHLFSSPLFFTSFKPSHFFKKGFYSTVRSQKATREEQRE